MDNTTKKLDEGNIPDDLLQNYYNTVAQNGWMLQSIPEEHRTAELCRMAIDKAGVKVTNTYTILDYIPKTLRTEEMCLRAVDRDGAAIRSVPEEVKTYEMCYRAIVSAGRL